MDQIEEMPDDATDTFLRAAFRTLLARESARISPTEVAERFRRTIELRNDQGHERPPSHE